MSTTSPHQSTTVSAPAPSPAPAARVTPALPLLGVAAAVAGVLGSTFLNAPFISDPAVFERGPEAVFATFDGYLSTQLGAAALYLCAALLVPFAFGMRTFLRSRPAGDAPAQTVSTLLLISAGVVTVAGILKSTLASGLPGGTDADFYTQVDVAVLYTVATQFQYAAFLPIVAAAGALGVASLRHGTMPRYVGAFSALIAVAVSGVTIAVNLPWSAGLVAPLWLLVVSFAIWRASRRT